MSMGLIQKYYNLKKIFKRVEKIDFMIFRSINYKIINPFFSLAEIFSSFLEKKWNDFSYREALLKPFSPCFYVPAFSIWDLVA